MSMTARMELEKFNQLDVASKNAHVGFIFEHSPWVVARTVDKFPGTKWPSVEALYNELLVTFQSGSPEERLQVLKAHPDLVGKAALEGKLSLSSTTEQASIFGDLTKEEVEFFQSNNALYQEKFGFPFIICVRLNKKESVKAALPQRLQNTRDQEFETAIGEVKKIALLRLTGVLSDGTEAKM